MTMEKTMTTAQKIAARFDGDGSTLTTVCGLSLADVCAAEGGTSESAGGDDYDLRRWIFEDGSVITERQDAAWDFGFADCFCWQGGGHDDACKATKSGCSCASCDCENPPSADAMRQHGILDAAEAIAEGRGLCAVCAPWPMGCESDGCREEIDHATGIANGPWCEAHRG